MYTTCSLVVESYIASIELNYRFSKKESLVALSLAEPLRCNKGDIAVSEVLRIKETDFECTSGTTSCGIL